MEVEIRETAKSLKRLLRALWKFLRNKLGSTPAYQKAYEDHREYIPFHSTFAAAKQAGLSLGDYIDKTCNVIGATQETVLHMKKLGVFDSPIERVCEIGPGTGRYLEKVIKLAKPNYCEIYETTKNWERWLVQEYNVVTRPADGRSLSHTPSNSIDLIQAHKVLPGQPSLIICRYFREMARVFRSGGKVVFDIVTEECLYDSTLEEWLATNSGYQHYPCLVPK